MTAERAAFRRVIAHLKADSGVGSEVGDRIYPNAAPEEVALPYIVVSLAGGRSTHVTGTARIMGAPLISVMVTDADNDTRAGALDAFEAADEALTASGNTFAGNHGDQRVHSAVHESPIDFDELEGGTRYHHIGGLYRIVVANV